MKKTVSVSIDADVLKIAKEKAWASRMTLSHYFETKLVSGWEASEVGKPVRKITKVKVVESPKTDEEILSKAQANLESIQDEQGINKYAKIERPNGMTNASWQIYRSAQMNKRRAL